MCKLVPMYRATALTGPAKNQPGATEAFKQRSKKTALQKFNPTVPSHKGSLKLTE